MGNSEVGHLNIGAGRIVLQDIVRISQAIADGTFFNNKAILDVFSFAREHKGKVHLLGLLSTGGVHSSFDHLLALIQMAFKQKCNALYIHAFLDGRDMPPKSAIPLIDKLQEKFRETGVGEIASVSGRYYAMDRDKRWDRLEKAYRVLVLSEGNQNSSARRAVEEAYARGETDEFIQPTALTSNGKPIAKIEDGDGVIFFNFRADRARQLTASLTRSDFSEFKLPRPKISFCSLTEYDVSFETPVAFPDQVLANTISEVWSKAGLTQFHTAETEKYAHVTYFFGGGREAPFPNEDRLLVPSPKVATYDLKPEMSAFEITQACLSRIAENRYDCVVMNFANADMVGHTGNLEATIKAIQVVDECVGQIVDAVMKHQGIIAITADHGNAEIMEDSKSGQPHTAHTTSPVPFILVDSKRKGVPLRAGGILADVAPTILQVQELAIPSEMTGSSLLS